MTTMLDVSRHAGVSRATVSYVLDNTGQVKRSMRQRVFKAVQALDYRPSFLACSLANCTSNSIGLVVSTFDGLYFDHLPQQVSCQTESHGKQLTVTDGHDTSKREQETVQMLVDRQHDAITLYIRYMSEKAIVSLMNSIAMPLSVTNRGINQARDRAIFFEQEDTAHQAVNYLISQSHSDIARITVPDHAPIGKSRLMGYRKALEKNSIPWDPGKIKYGDPAMTRDYRACRRLLEEGVKFNALSTYNDDMALGTSKALHQAGLRIPTNISLFGFDDAPSARWLEPGLSTAYLSIDTMIATAIDQVIRLANGESVEPTPPFADKLVPRDSMTTGPYYK